ncbi:MAG: hypothetical protein IJY97_01010 [Clostridia bacterium]|nr:hypothetical protein [Clostridia bacterium]
MKRIIMILLALCMVASFVACNEGGEVTTEAPETTAAPTETEAPDAETTAAETEVAFNGYKVTVTDKDGNPIAGVQIQMCDSKGCRMPQGTGADGTVTFDFDTSDFHVLIAAPVDGYAVDTTEEYFFENGGKELTIVLEKK